MKHLHWSTFRQNIRLAQLGLLLICSLIIAATPLASAQEAGSDTEDYLAQYGILVYAKPEECGNNTSGIQATGNDNVQYAFNYMVAAFSSIGDNNLAKIHAAGVAGNLYEESGGINPFINEGGGGPGRGIAQWSVDGRWAVLLKWASDNNKGSPLDKTKLPGTNVPKGLQVQLDFLWHEMQNVSPWKQSIPAVRATTTVPQATEAFMNTFEKPGIPHLDVRIADANMIYTRYGGGAPIGTDPVNSNPGGACVTGGGLGGIPTGSSQELAKKILASPNITFQTKSGLEAFKPVAASPQGIQPSSCGDVQISARLLGVLLAVSQKYKIVIGGFSQGHDCDGLNHPKGLAVDLNGVNPLDGQGGTGNSIEANEFGLPIMKSYYEDLGQLLNQSGNSAGMGQIFCWPASNKPKKFPKVTYFDDGCNHLHVDVGKY